MEKRICRKCGEVVSKSDLEEYSYQCENCDEDLYEFETLVVEKETVENVN